MLTFRVSNKKKLRGVAQLVARLVRDQEVMGSNPVTPTKKNDSLVTVFFSCVTGFE